MKEAKKERWPPVILIPQEH